MARPEMTPSANQPLAAYLPTGNGNRQAYVLHVFLAFPTEAARIII
jgi:hypothetical protein